jgi:hypothetical protein
MSSNFLNSNISPITNQPTQSGAHRIWLGDLVQSCDRKSKIGLRPEWHATESSIGFIGLRGHKMMIRFFFVIDVLHVLDI